MSDATRSLHEQLAQAEENLRLIQERKAQYVLDTDIPLQLIRDERRQEVEIAGLRERLARLVELPCPYRGLLAFREEDAPFFFGRETFTQRLVEAVERHALVAVVVGPSGSGKSSVVFAGLLPRLRQVGTEWITARFRPTSTPFDELTSALLPLLEPEMSRTDRLIALPKLASALRMGDVALSSIVTGISEVQPQASRLLLVVDQFEELYTLCSEPETRQRFLDMLLVAVSSPPAGPATAPGIASQASVLSLTLVITLRADFLSQALAYRPLADALDGAQTLMLGPMTPQELEAAIARPAQQQGVTFEDGLVARILDDVGDEPGNLPLLEFALTQLWEQQAGGRLTHEAYDAIGRVEGALAHHADQVYGELSAAEQEQARRVFVQLVRPGVGTDDTRRRAARVELGEANWSLVQRLANARLVVTDLDPAGGEVVEVAHEALIQGWAQLKDWMAEDRTFRVWQERLRAALRQWDASKRDVGALLRGVPLAEAEGWMAKRGHELNSDERAYIQRSVAQRERERAAREQLRRRITVGLVTGLIVVAFATFAGVQWSRAERQRTIAQARLLAAQSVLTDRLDLSLLLGLEASRLDTAEVKGALLAGLESDPQVVTFQHRHTDYVFSVAFSRDGRWLASGSKDGTVVLWNTATRRPLEQPLRGHEDTVWSVAFSPDSRTLASGSSDGTVILWDVATGQPVLPPLAGHEADVYSVAFSSDGRTLASSSGSERNTIILWDVETGQRIGEPLTGHRSPVGSVAFSPDGQTLASGSEDNTVMLWDMATGQRIGEPLTGHSADVFSVAFSPDGQILASGSSDQTIVLWELGTLPPISHTLTGHAADVFSVAFSPDGQTLASGSRDHTVALWDVGTRQRQQRLVEHLAPVRAVAFSPSGRTLASGSYDNTVIVWDIETRQRLGRSLTDQAFAVHSVAFSPDGRTLASGGDDGNVILWDVMSGRPVAQPTTRHEGRVYSVAFSPDGQTLASGSDDRTVILWDVTTALPIGEPFSGHERAVYSVAFSPDGQQVASGSADGTIALWNVATGHRAGEPFAGRANSVRGIAFSPDGRTLASGNSDNTIVLWNAATGQPIDEPLRGHRADVISVAFSRDGRLLASGSVDGTVILWDVADHRQIGPPLIRHVDTVMSVAFSPDGNTVASGSLDNSVILWDVETRQSLGRPLTGHTWDVFSVAFSPDGQTLASGSRDKRIVLWDVSFESWQARACDIVARNLTPQEWEQYLGDQPYQKTCPEYP